MNKAPTVSVIMSVYNGQEYLAEAIDSILAQTFKDFEFLVIDDGSTDDSPKIIDKYAKRDKRIKVIRQTNKGLIAALNKGLGLARGTYIARMDADDISLPTRLEKQVAYLEKNPGVGVIATHILAFDNNTGQRLHIWPEEINTHSFQEIRACLPFANCVAHTSVMARARIIKEYRYARYQPKIEDYDLWLRLVADGYIIEKLSEELLLYRVSAQSITGSDTNRFRIVTAKRKFLLRRLLHLKFHKFERSVFVALMNDYVEYLRYELRRVIR